MHFSFKCIGLCVTSLTEQSWALKAELGMQCWDGLNELKGEIDTRFLNGYEDFLFCCYSAIIIAIIIMIMIMIIIIYVVVFVSCVYSTIMIMIMNIIIINTDIIIIIFAAIF